MPENIKFSPDADLFSGASKSDKVQVSSENIEPDFDAGLVPEFQAVDRIFTQYKNSNPGVREEYLREKIREVAQIRGIEWSVLGKQFWAWKRAQKK